MTTNSNKPLQLTEKSGTHETDTKSEETNKEFIADINNIYTHFDNGTMTKQIFKSFVTTLNTQISQYKQQITTLSCKKSVSKKTVPSIPEIDVSALISSVSLITSFSRIQGRSPKCKLSVSFYPQFLTFITQSKHAKDEVKTVIYYSNIERIICVPEKNDDMLLFVQLLEKVPLRWRKSQIDCFAISFERRSNSAEDNTEIEICNLNTSLPSKIRGNTEVQFSTVISKLTSKDIDRHDQKLFGNALDKKKRFFMDGSQGFNQCQIYPLRAGVLITPKPLRFIPQSRINYYEYARIGNELRYVDLDIILFPKNKSNDKNESELTPKTKRKMAKECTLSLTMIDKSEVRNIDNYFRQMNIKQKMNGKEICDRKMNENGETERSEASECESDSSDEEYKVEEDSYNYSDESDSDYSGSEGTESEGSDSGDIDMERNTNTNQKNTNKKNTNQKKVKKARKQRSPKKIVKNVKKSPKSPKKQRKNRKRKRAEIESVGSAVCVDESVKKRFKTLNFGRRTPVGRKTITPKGQSSGERSRIVSKSVKKKSKSPKKNVLHSIIPTSANKTKNGKKNKSKKKSKGKEKESLLTFFAKKSDQIIID